MLRRIALSLSILICIGCLIGGRLPVFAGIGDTGVDTANGETLLTNPKSRTISVSATVDVIPPSIPILVSPTDTSTVNTTKPTFIWKQSTDEQGISKYQFWMDNNLVYDNLPISSTTNDQYTLVYQDGQYQLTPKTDLGQGTHSWYIKVYGMNSNSSVSATWSFTVDTLAPLIIVTSVGSTTQNIRSDNSASVPLTPIRLDANSPIISGTVETGAVLKMTLVVPGIPNQTTLVVLTSPNFSFTLPVLPVDTIVYISFTSNDAIGNTSVITNIPILVQAAVIILPFPSPTAIVVPRITEITNVPAPENRLPVVKEIVKQLPSSAQTFISTPLATALSNIVPILTLAAPAAVAIATAVQTSFSLLPLLLEILSRILQSIGLIPVKRPRGIVFDTKTGKPIPFATITFIRTKDNEIIDSVISDTAGIYRTTKLPPEVYRIEVVHSEYTFPTKVNPKFIVNPHDFYRGENFEIKSANQEEIFLIPMDPKALAGATHRKIYRAIYLGSLRRLVHGLFYPIVVLSVVITLLFPTLLNIAILLIYAFMILYRYSQAKREPWLSGEITNRQKLPMPNVMIKCVESGTNQVDALLVSDEHGRFGTHLVPHEYNLLINKDGYVIDQESLDYSNVFITHTGKEGRIKIKLMTIAEAFPETK